MADMTGDDEWSDWEDEDMPAKSLLEDRLLPSAKEALKYDKDTHGLDLLALGTKLNLDFYGCVKLVNYVRTEVGAAKEDGLVGVKATAAAIEDRVVSSLGGVLADEKYLRPALEDDAVLLCLEELLLPADADADADEPMERGYGERKQRSAGGANAPDENSPPPPPQPRKPVDTEMISGGKRAAAAAALTGEEEAGVPTAGATSTDLVSENARLREALRDAEERVRRADRVLRDLVVGGDGEGEGGGGGGGVRAKEGSSDGSGEGQGPTAGVVDNDTYYFRSYAHWGVHETMLTDTVRTGGYERAICDNADFFQGKVVLDVGCGTGVLSCFAARAGARKVIGVDRSDIVVKARKVVRDNGFDKIVTLIQGKVEDVDIGVDKVDIIISEWMGYCLFYESMLPSVLIARDKYLAEGGVVLPDRTPLFIQGWRDPDRRLEFWKNVHGLDYSSMADLPLDEASVEVVGRRDLVTERCLFQDFNIETVNDEDLDFEAPFKMIVTSPGTVSGLVISFDTGFFARSDPPPPPPPPPPSCAQYPNTGALGPSATKGSNSSAANEQGAGTGSAAGPGGAGGGHGGVTPTAVDGQDGGGLLQSDERGPPVASWFSTGPKSKPTHWKQTLLWLRPSDRAEMVLDVGDAVAGRLTLDRNEVNPRELGLTVTWTAARQSTGETFGGTQAYTVC